MIELFGCVKCTAADDVFNPSYPTGPVTDT